MATLTQKSLFFNRKIKLSNDGGELSSDTGELLFREFDEQLGFSKVLSDHLTLQDDRKFVFHTNQNILRQKIYQIIAGYSEDDASDQLTSDPIFTKLIGVDSLASQPSLSRFYSRFDEQSIDHLLLGNQCLVDKVHRFRKSDAIIFDLDSTHADTYGEQESTAYNTHYGTVGFHPLVAFDGITGDFLKAKLRPGNVYTSNGVVDFIEPLINHYNDTFPETTALLRGDSGFAVPQLYKLCEKESVYYVIRLKSNRNLQRLADEYHPSHISSDLTESECLIDETEYQAKSWSKPRKVIIRSERPAGELFFTHTFFVTNLGDAFTPEAIVHSYQKRGTMENFIKEAKNGFNFDRMCSHSFQVNESRMILSLLAYNLVNWMRTLCFPTHQKNMQIQTIRMRIIKVASKLVKTGRSAYFKLASSFVYQAFFWQVLERIQEIQIK
ncbi:mobile element protein [Gracilibacillus boraciitolerans JCM 21714]|uniref:Mobile element protein n=1 Tax=Gracilibacillus boraciitolerans JCM 21714 TaxID=1298598 RepID=W4VQK9_9BACI|nr:IS1380 family transposase [Gracilibacillus boraciitolerans]GAE95507.1 mobile element protein [Gracilibacillus boraciitolerans JCM 21714]